jgi:glutamate synthase domain-containing protein 2
MLSKVSHCRLVRKKNVSLSFGSTTRSDSSSSLPEKNTDIWSKERVNAYVGHSFPDFIEGWNRKVYRKVGYCLAGSSAMSIALTALTCDSILAATSIPAVILTVGTAAYFSVGESDISQTSHAVRRNYPVIGNLRYVLETIRPELRQYIVESDMDGRPFDRMHRAQVYQRAKNVNDSKFYFCRQNFLLWFRVRFQFHIWSRCMIKSSS